MAVSAEGVRARVRQSVAEGAGTDSEVRAKRGRRGEWRGLLQQLPARLGRRAEHEGVAAVQVALSARRRSVSELNYPNPNPTRVRSVSELKWRLPRLWSGLAPEVEVVQAVPVPPHALQPQLRVYELHLRVGVKVSVCTNSKWFGGRSGQWSVPRACGSQGKSQGEG